MLAATIPPKAGESALIEAENQVSAQRASATTWDTAKPVMPISFGDSLRTGPWSRAVVRLTALSAVRLDQSTTIRLVQPAPGDTNPAAPVQVLAMSPASTKPAVNLVNGALFYLSRDKTQELEVQTLSGNAILEGTEFVVRVDKDKNLTQIMMLDGTVKLQNANGSMTVKNGEAVEALDGQAPHPIKPIQVADLIQWTLYYPAVIYPPDLAMEASEQTAVADSLAAYNAGDLLGALDKYPTDRQPGTSAGQLYRAAVLLAVGRVDDAQDAMAKASDNAPGRRALEIMISAVKSPDVPRSDVPQTASEWLAEAYYLQAQSRSDNHLLEQALTAAKRSTKLAPDFGYAWVKEAELYFSQRDTSQALAALDQGLKLTPENAEAFALQGFLFSAQNRMVDAQKSFNQAIDRDGALGNAWLGRGLTEIREGQEEAGLRDLQIAATLEPSRAVLHSYLGKAYSDAGQPDNAKRDLKRAKELDPKDPTAWLYSAIQDAQENRYNEAINDLEESAALNDNRSIFRSQFLLDEDRSIRGTNLAAIYLNDGML